MYIANTHEAKTNLSKLIDLVLNDKEVVIAKAGKPVARLIAYKPSVKPRKSGLWKGKVWLSDDFTKESEEINTLFYR